MEIQTKDKLLEQISLAVEQVVSLTIHNMLTLVHYTAKNATDLLQVVNFTISSSCNKSAKIRLVAICHLDLKQLATSPPPTPTTKINHQLNDHFPFVN